MFTKADIYIEVLCEVRMDFIYEVVGTGYRAEHISKIQMEKLISCDELRWGWKTGESKSTRILCPFRMPLLHVSCGMGISAIVLHIVRWYGRVSAQIFHYHLSRSSLTFQTISSNYNIHIYMSKRNCLFMCMRTWFLFDFVRLLVVWGFEFENVFIHILIGNWKMKSQIIYIWPMTNVQHSINLSESVLDISCALEIKRWKLDKPKIYRIHS